MGTDGMDVKVPADQVAARSAPDAGTGVRVLPLILGRWGPLGRPAVARRRRARRASRASRAARVRARIGLIIAAAFLVLLVLWAIVPGVFAGTDPTAVNPLAALTGPSVHNFLGTDQYGRSIYDELVYGARPALEVGVGSTLLGGAVGSLIGIVGGYLGGWFDLLIMRLIDMLLALPGLLLALIFIAALPRTLSNEIFAIAIASVPIFARVLRGQAVQVRSRPFVDAAVVSGLRRRTIVIRHVIPNCVAPAMELATVYVGVAIVIAASLSFLGLGPSEVVPDWGTLIQSGQGYIDHDWWISVFPGVTVTLAVIALSILGDRLRGALEPVRG
ncbi:ABC transporter permease [Trebonia sp.]|uniref:ABC transporter permease n=1 Tax=Trebonia sp. TaxID=2767075 RepID=UPI00261E3F5A|nr:ABC transporter permease [Trebonia sp.]